MRSAQDARHPCLWSWSLSHSLSECSVSPVVRHWTRPLGSRVEGDPVALHRGGLQCREGASIEQIKTQATKTRTGESAAEDKLGAQIRGDQVGTQEDIENQSPIPRWQDALAGPRV